MTDTPAKKQDTTVQFCTGCNAAILISPHYEVNVTIDAPFRTVRCANCGTDLTDGGALFEGLFHHDDVQRFFPGLEITPAEQEEQ